MGLDSWLHRKRGFHPKPSQEKYHWAWLSLEKAVISESFLYPFSTAWTCLWSLLQDPLFCWPFLLQIWEKKNCEALTWGELARGRRHVYLLLLHSKSQTGLCLFQPFFFSLPFFPFFIFLMLKSRPFQTHSPIFCSAGWCKCATFPSNPSTLSYHHPSLSFSPAVWCPCFPRFPSFLLCTVAAFLLLSHRLCCGRVMSPPRVATGWWLQPTGVGSAVGTEGKQALCLCA